MISWNRFYDPETGRYISADPIGLAGGINLYAYTGGDPLNAIDFSGLLQWNNTGVYYTYFNPGDTVNDFIYTGENKEIGKDTLGVSIPRFSMKVRCVKTGFLSWKLSDEGVAIDFSTQIYLRAGGYLSQEQAAWVKRGENDHASDFDSWANNTGKAVAETTENSLRNQEWCSKKSCEENVYWAMIRALRPTLMQAVNDSIRRWDSSGLHNWNNPNRRP